MDISTLTEQIKWFEALIENALRNKYPPEFIENHILLRWSIEDFLEKYISAKIYPTDRINYLILSLFDIKLELYYLLEVEPGLENRLVIDAGYDKKNPESTPHLLLLKLSLEQSIILKSRILWERLMNFIYYLENGKQLEISGNKSKKKKFFDFINQNGGKWNFLLPYKSEIESFDNHFRTPEAHKNSVLRAWLFGSKQIDPNELLNLVNRAINIIWENILDIISGNPPHHFTDIHINENNEIDDIYFH